MRVTPPRLVDTATAAAFVMHVRGQQPTEAARRAARERVYNLAKAGKIKNHGGTGRGQALWDLKELAYSCA